MARSPSSEARRGLAADSRILTSLLVLLCAAACAEESAPASDPLAFARRSEPLAERDSSWLRGVASPQTVRVFEPYEAREIEFRALSFERVLDAVYGSTWRDEEELLLSCSDGYQPTIPVARVLEHRAWLAFARADQPDFSIRKRESGKIQRISLAPYYLIWENLDDARVRQEADYGWPYQLVGIDLIRRADRFPKMSPPADASPEVLAGFAAFRVHCSKCHKLNGEGGSIGPELNAAASPLQYRDRDWLRTWIEDPSRILPSARMPALNPALPDRARTVEEILAYLQAMFARRDAAAAGAG